MCLTVVGTGALVAGATNLTNDLIKEKQDQVDKAREEKESLQNGLTDLKQLKKELESQKDSLSSYVVQLDGNLSDIEDKVGDLKLKIIEKEAEIAQSEQELAEAEEKAESQRQAMVSRIRKMYEMGDHYMVDMILKSTNFGDFLNKADYVELIMSYDQRMLSDFQQTVELIEVWKEELEVEREVLEIARQSVEAEQANLEDLIEQKNKDIYAFETDINNKDAAIAEYEEYIRQQDAEIEALEAAIAAEKKRLLEESGEVISYDGGAFKFPLASYTRVSDDYGWRIHPTLGVEKFHNGVDFAAPAGTAIYAAYDGNVVAATYSATMGNYVMIDHGGGLYTIYMHASALYVSKGDIVVRGDTIAAVGTTGRSTGNHLHFGVRYNGEYVSPWNYISK